MKAQDVNGKLWYSRGSRKKDRHEVDILVDWDFRCLKWAWIKMSRNTF